jgi:ketosteroid isomerase-like protein
LTQNIRRFASLACVLALATSACATRPPPLEPAELRREVTEAELAFARTMANRDLTAFGAFIADDAVFFSGPTPLRGRDAVVGYWRRFFEGPEAPFSWAPDEVEIADGGRLAWSTGPVRDPAGRETGRYHSVWQRQPDGRWQVLFDVGSQ